MPVVGLGGLYVAKTPTSRPEIPKTADTEDEEFDSIDESADTEDDDFDPKVAAAIPIGHLVANESESPIVMNDLTEELDEELDESEATESVSSLKPVNKKLKVPSFNKFRIGLILGVLGLVALITGWIFATIILPKAGVAIATDGSTVASTINLTLSTNAKTLDIDKSIVPASAQTISKTQTQEVSASGQINNGKKSKGSIIIVSSVCTLPAKKPGNVSTGTAVTNNNNVYITQETAFFDDAPKLSSDGSCLVYKSNSISITALKAGASYNTDDDASFAVKSSYVGSGSTSGGTDEIIKVLSQTDIDSAKTKLETLDTTQVKSTLADELSKNNLIAAESTFLAGEPQISTSANVGDEVESVKVTSTVQYSMLGVKEDYIEQLLMVQLNDKIDEKKQKILDSGIQNVDFSQEAAATAQLASVTAKIKTQIGPNIDVVALRKQITGQKAADVKKIINQTPGVTDVEVAYSPFWVTRVPKNSDKVSIIIDGKTY